MVLRFIYIIFIGVLLALFVGVGIAAFYKGPQPPEHPQSLRYAAPGIETEKSPTESARIQQEQEKYDQAFKAYTEESEEYNRNVSIIALIASILILVISLLLLNKIFLIADGLLLGGVLTLMYSIIRGFESGDEMFRFFVVTVGLIVALVLGYIKFIKPQQKTG